MKPVAIACANALVPENRWNTSLAELALDAAAPIVAEHSVDAVFAAGWNTSLLQHQGDFAAIVADRLGLRPRVSLTLDAADVSGAAALYAAFVHVAHGLCSSALVVGAGKVSDLSEADRLALLDSALDQEAETSSGLSFASQAGLLAARYCEQNKKDARAFADISAANISAWIKRTGGANVTGADLKGDLIVAPPLARTDFSLLLDGACAVLLQSESHTAHAHIDAFAGASDIVAIWERRDPLKLGAVSDAASAAIAGRARPRWIEIDSAVSVVQLLTQDALVSGGDAGAINRLGGTQGRGRVPGASPLYQMCDILEPDPPSDRVLAVAVAGLGSRAFAAHISVGRQ